MAPTNIRMVSPDGRRSVGVAACGSPVVVDVIAYEADVGHHGTRWVFKAAFKTTPSDIMAGGAFTGWAVDGGPEALDSFLAAVRRGATHDPFDGVGE